MTRRPETTRDGSGVARLGGGFTLVELLVVMAVIAVISVIVVAGFTGIAREARLSSGANTVVAALGNARALAMKNNRPVMVVFRPRLLDDRGTQVVEIVAAQWMGDSYRYENDDGFWEILDRYEPIPGAPVRRLARGIKVAGPLYAETTVADASSNPSDAELRDDQWATQAQLTEIDPDNPTGSGSEPPGRLLGVMFGADGAILGSNPKTDATAAFIDFNVDPTAPNISLLHRNAAYVLTPISRQQITGDIDGPYPTSLLLAEHYLDADEPTVTLVPFLAVFDDEEFRELFDPEVWKSDLDAFEQDLRLYLSENASRIHFNTYTGVALR